MSNQPIQLTLARIIPYTFERHGYTLVDNYAWLQKKDDPEVLAFACGGGG